MHTTYSILYLITRIAIFTLLLVTITYSNLTTAQSLNNCKYYSDQCTICDETQLGECTEELLRLIPFEKETCFLEGEHCLTCDEYIFHGCEDDQQVENPYLSDEESDECHISMCIAGGYAELPNQANSALERFCQSEYVHNPILSCKGDKCMHIWNGFLYKIYTSVYPALFKALDFNHDGRVDHKDPKCRLDLIGYSWGGVTAMRLARMMKEDWRIDSSHKEVRQLISFDGYQPFAYRDIEIPSTVKKARIFIRSEFNGIDCSADQFRGPYAGLYPRCEQGTDCLIYDWSTVNNYIPFNDLDVMGPIHSRDIDHCKAIGASLPAAMSLLKGEDYLGVLPRAIIPEIHWPPEEDLEDEYGLIPGIDY